MSNRTLISLRRANMRDGSYNVHLPVPYPYHVNAEEPVL